MIHKDEELGILYYLSLNEAKEDGFTPVKVVSLLQVFTLEGKKTTLLKENLIPIPDLRYLIHSKAEDKYFIREYRGYSIDDLYFYYQRVGQSDEGIESFMRYVYDGNVYLLLTDEVVESTKEMLKRLFKAQLRKEGTLKYNTYLYLLEESLKLQEHRLNNSNKDGYKTIIKVIEDRINSVWANELNPKPAKVVSKTEPNEESGQTRRKRKRLTHDLLPSDRNVPLKENNALNRI